MPYRALPPLRPDQLRMCTVPAQRTNGSVLSKARVLSRKAQMSVTNTTASGRQMIGSITGRRLAHRGRGNARGPKTSLSAKSCSCRRRQETVMGRHSCICEARCGVCKIGPRTTYLLCWTVAPALTTVLHSNSPGKQLNIRTII